jgi:squamous cell carcinoma antigen recognized by T-cells 3
MSTEIHIIPLYRFVETTLRIKEISLPVVERALRNVPWDGRLWVANLRAGERFAKDHLEMQSCLESALVAGLSTSEDYRTVWEAYLDYLRRRVPWDEQDQKDLIKVGKMHLKQASYSVTI